MSTITQYAKDQEPARATGYIVALLIAVLDLLAIGGVGVEGDFRDAMVGFLTTAVPVTLILVEAIRAQVSPASKVQELRDTITRAVTSEAIRLSGTSRVEYPTYVSSDPPSTSTAPGLPDPNA